MTSKSSKTDFFANIFNLEIGDSISRGCCERLLKYIVEHDDIELEGKIGNIKSTKGTSRVVFDSIHAGFLLLSPGFYAFESRVAKPNFQHLSTVVLRGAVLKCRQDSSLSPVYYTKRTLTDSFYMVNGKRVRVTREDDKIVECIVKDEVENGHCDILNNKGQYDCRISLKREIKHDPPPPGIAATYTRNKIRESFSTPLWSIDLTEVRTNNEPEATYEIEIELRKNHLGFLRLEAQRYSEAKGDGEGLLKILKSLIDTLMTLTYYLNPQLQIPLVCQFQGDAPPRPLTDDVSHPSTRLRTNENDEDKNTVESSSE